MQNSYENFIVHWNCNDIVYCFTTKNRLNKYLGMIFGSKTEFNEISYASLVLKFQSQKVNEINYCEKDI